MFVPSAVLFFGNLGEKPCIYFLLPRIKLVGGEVVLLPPSASSHACKQTGGMSHRLAVMSQWCSDVTRHAVVTVTALRPHGAERGA